ncbi:MAG: hypothetical protein ACPLXM_13770 [Bacteroidales bacterium]
MGKQNHLIGNWKSEIGNQIIGNWVSYHHKYIFSFLLSVSVILPSFSQPVSLPLSRDLEYFYIPKNDTGYSFHPSVRPYLADEHKPALPGLFYFRNKEKDSAQKFRAFVRPLVNATAGYGRDFLYRAGAGAELLTQWKRNLSLDLQYIYNAAVFPSLYDSLVSAGYVPHAGLASYQGSGGQMQWGSVTGSLAWMPLRSLVLETGIGRNFWGEGYRSLFLSDNSNAYPYVKTTVRVWHIKYISLLGFLRDVNLPGSRNRLLAKYGAFHYLSWNVIHRLNLSFFEAVIWNGNDSIRHRGYDFQYMIPVVVYRPVEHWIGSPDNALLGAAGSYKLSPAWTVYTQFMLDELVVKEFLQGTGWAGNKYALQVGIKAREPFGKEGLHLLAEMNLARPYTWSHRSTLNNYGAWYQPLAHPAGGNFMEGLAEGKYRAGRNLLSVFLSYTAAGRDSGLFNAGNDIYRNYTTDIARRNVDILQGEAFRQVVWSAGFGRLVIPRAGLMAGIQCAGRLFMTGSRHGWEVFAGVWLRTMLFNDEWFEK